MGVKRLMVMLLLFTVASLQAFAQTKDISGVVTDDMGEAAIGATVKVKGTDIGTLTDVDGKYTLTGVPQDAQTLEVSYMGFTTREVPISGGTVDVSLKEDATATTLEDLVVTGYGSGVARTDLTGTINSVGGKALKDIPVSSAAEALSGKLAGVQVTATEGSPDADIKIRVRGGGSVTQSSEPLYIVDGFPVDNINDIPPGNIKSIDVLKDASATAIYGARGANGVINVTTKEPSEGKFSVDYAGFIGWKKITKTLDVLDSRDFVLSQYERAASRSASNGLASGSNGQKSPFFRYFAPNYEMYNLSAGDAINTHFNDIMDYWTDEPTVDWQDEIFGRTGFTSNHSLTINGGGKVATYSVNYNRVDDKAIMYGSDYQRDFLEFKLNAKPFNNLKLNFRARYTDTRVAGSGATDATGNGGVQESRMRQTVRYMPYGRGNIGNRLEDPRNIGYGIIPLFRWQGGTDTGEDEDLGGLNPYTNSALIYPDLYIDDNHKETHKINYAYNGGLAWDIKKGLQFQSKLSFDRSYNSEYRYYGPSSSKSKDKTTFVLTGPGVAGQPNNFHPLVTTKDEQRTRFTNSNTIEWKTRSKDGKHNFTTLLGEETVVRTGEFFNLQVEGLPTEFDEITGTPTEYPKKDEALGYLNSNGVNRVKSYPSYAYDDKMLSFFGRFDYNYKSKYYATITVRGDASNKFPADKHWGIFPSGVVSWRVSDEQFMRPTKSWLSNLKARLSYGAVGNNDIPTGTYKITYESDGHPITPSITQSPDEKGNRVFPNLNLTWETMVTRNFGLDFGFLKDRINGTVDLYWNTTQDLLILYPVPGFDGQYRNMGSTSNKGVELTLNTAIIDKKNYGVDFSFNISYNKSRIDDYNGVETVSSNWSSGGGISNDFRIQEGQPLGAVYGYEYDGRYDATDFKYTAPTSNGATGHWSMNDTKFQQIPGKKLTDGSDDLKYYEDGDPNKRYFVEPWSTGMGYGPGGLKVKDRNGDGKINEDDKTIIGYTVPEITGGFTLSARYKQFDLAANFYYVLGNDIYNANKIDYTTLGEESHILRNFTSDVADGKRWTFINQVEGWNGYAAGEYITNPDHLNELNANTTTHNPFMKTGILTSDAIEDGSFLRLSTLTLGYTVPKNLLTKYHISNLRVYFSAGNLFCLTNYSGFDPEADTMRKNPLTPGVDFSGYPKSRSYNIGMNLTF